MLGGWEGPAGPPVLHPCHQILRQSLGQEAVWPGTYGPHSTVGALQPVGQGAQQNGALAGVRRDMDLLAPRLQGPGAGQPATGDGPSPAGAHGTASRGIQQDIYHLWVLRCKSQLTLLGFPAAFNLLDEPGSFQAPQAQMLWPGSLPDTPRTSVPESVTPGFPAPDTADPTAELPPSPHTQPQTHPRPKAIGTRREIISSCDHGGGRSKVHHLGEGGRSRTSRHSS